MKNSTLTSITSGLSIISLCLLLIVSFSVEASAKRGCSAFGHSCFGGHGKRSNLDDQTRLRNVGADLLNTNDATRAVSSVNDAAVNMDNDEFQQLRDFIKCQNCDAEIERRARDDGIYVPLLIRKMLLSYRRPYNADLPPNDK